MVKGVLKVKYKLYLPTKEELKAEIETQKAMFYLQQQDNIPAFYSKWFLNRIKEECVYRLLQ